MIKIKEFVQNDVDDYVYRDVKRIINVCAKYDIEITEEEAEELWSNYSDEYCAQWLGLPESDEYLFEIVIKQAQSLWGGKDEG